MSVGCVRPATAAANFYKSKTPGFMFELEKSVGFALPWVHVRTRKKFQVRIAPAPSRIFLSRKIYLVLTTPNSKKVSGSHERRTRKKFQIRNVHEDDT